MPLFFIGFVFFLSGCQLLESFNNKEAVLNNLSRNDVVFSHYYLWIKSLNDDEIAQEIIKKKIISKLVMLMLI